MIRRALAIGLPCLFAVGATVALAWNASNTERLRVEREFQTQTNGINIALAQRLGVYPEMVAGISALYAASKHVDEGEFRAFVAHAIDTGVAVRALSWVERVSPDGRDDFVAKARADGLPGFTLKRWTESGWTTQDAHWADTSYVVRYIEPHEGNEAAFGLDLYSNPARRAALERARDTGLSTATEQIVLAQESGPERAGILLAAPVYKPLLPPDATVEMRRKHIVGFGVGVYRVGDIIEAATAGFDLSGIGIQVTDISSEHYTLYVSGPQEGHIGKAQVLEIGGRRLQLRVIASQAYIAAHSSGSVWVFGLLGGIATLLLAGFLYSQSGRSERIRQMVDEQTDELNTANVELRMATQTLERSNVDLQQFAYIASHDLKEPLRAISGFAQLLNLQYAPALDDKARKYISFIEGGVVRMQALIDDLLTYAQIESKSRPFEPIDLNQACDDAAEFLGPSLEDAKGKVTRDTLPTVMGDRSQLVQLFQNLVGNGIKYQNPEVSPQIHVTAEEQAEDWLIRVKDNGIGVAPEHHARIFEMFRRLHTKQQYPGTGIGLALCRRIVNRHGGQIWLESVVGAGSTFSFTIRKKSAP